QPDAVVQGVLLLPDGDGVDQPKDEPVGVVLVADGTAFRPGPGARGRLAVPPRGGQGQRLLDGLPPVEPTEQDPVSLHLLLGGVEAETNDVEGEPGVLVVAEELGQLAHDLAAASLGDRPALPHRPPEQAEVGTTDIFAPYADSFATAHPPI